MKSILIIIGTRPEAIKLCPLVIKLRTKFIVKICTTGQHREILTQMLDVFKIKHEFNLDVMKYNQDLIYLTSEILKGVNNLIYKNKFDCIIVQGDTISAFAAALAAFYNKVPIIHVEAGLRTWNNYSPFPEEINRQQITKLAYIHFAPTDINKENLIKEGINEKNIIVTGNTVIDAMYWVLNHVKEPKWNFPFIPHKIKLIIVTCHRRENFGDKLNQICWAIKKLAEKNSQIEIIFSLHPNPNVQVTVKKILCKIDNIHLIDPLNYCDFIHLMKHSYFIITDSGGIQEEAPSLGKPVLVTRDTTERPEAVEVGTVKLVGSSQKKIYQLSQKLLDDKKFYNTMAYAHNPYGDGTASEKIKRTLENILI